MDDVLRKVEVNVVGVYVPTQEHQEVHYVFVIPKVLEDKYDSKNEITYRMV